MGLVSLSQAEFSQIHQIIRLGGPTAFHQMEMVHLGSAAGGAASKWHSRCPCVIISTVPPTRIPQLLLEASGEVHYDQVVERECGQDSFHRLIGSISECKPKPGGCHSTAPCRVALKVSGEGKPPITRASDCPPGHPLCVEREEA